MSPAEVISALAAHDARVAVEGDRVRVLFKPGHPPPAELVEAARQHKDALRTMAIGPMLLAASLPLPDYIVAGLARLKVCGPLWIMTAERWAIIIETANRVAMEHGATALRLGWRDVDLFGLHPKAPGARHDCRGLGACPSNRCSNPSESDSSLDYEQALSPLEYRSDAASAAECAGLRAQGPRLAVYR
jgi:hypothetical protein